nr:probable DNA-directed RNA polymerase subunit delta [Hydra vulgaris]
MLLSGVQSSSINDTQCGSHIGLTESMSSQWGQSSSINDTQCGSHIGLTESMSSQWGQSSSINDTQFVSRNKMWQKSKPETIVIEDEQELDFHPIDLTTDEFFVTLNEKTQNQSTLTKIKMEVIYNDVNKAIYKYGKPELKPYEKLIPYEAMFVDGDSVFNLKNIDIVDEKEDYEDDYDEDDDYDYYDYDEDDDYDDYDYENDYYENDYNEVDEIDNEMAVEYDNDEDNGGDKEPMEIDN